MIKIDDPVHYLRRRRHSHRNLSQAPDGAIGGSINPKLEKKLLNALGKTIKRRRKATGSSKNAFAHQCGVTQPTVTNIESGYNSTILVYAKIAAGLDLSLQQLFSEAGV